MDGNFLDGNLLNRNVGLHRRDRIFRGDNGRTFLSLELSRRGRWFVGDGSSEAGLSWSVLSRWGYFEGSRRDRCNNRNRGTCRG
jgi:hypothetical protein